jgi:hypothetical protein
MLGQTVMEVVRDEASFLASHESNWAGVYGLPGRRESHLVSALHNHLRSRFDVRCVLDDSLWGRPDTRCDLAALLDAGTDRWAWIEMKTMPHGDANDKLASLHGDVVKLDEAARLDRRNLPQAIVAIGYDVAAGRLAERFRGFAERHGLHRWPHKLEGDRGVESVELPQTHDAHYTQAIVGVWGRDTVKTRVKPCDGRCHLVPRE